MPYYAQLNDGVVTAVTETSESLPASDNLVEIDGLHFDLLGMKREGDQFVPVPLPAPTVTYTISRAQGKTVLIQMGLWPSVLDFIAAIPDATERAIAEVALHDTQEWRRNSPFLNQVAFILNLSDEQMDNLFITASQINL